MSKRKSLATEIAAHQRPRIAMTALREPRPGRTREPEDKSSAGARIGDLAPYEFVPTAANGVQPGDPASTMRHRPIRLLRLPQVTALVGLRRSAIYEMQADGRFPRRVKLGARAVGWIEDEVQAWLVQRVAENDSPPALKRRLEKASGGAAK
jgi:prophage regulatory protein